MNLRSRSALSQFIADQSVVQLQFSLSRVSSILLTDGSHKHDLSVAEIWSPNIRCVAGRIVLRRPPAYSCVDHTPRAVLSVRVHIRDLQAR